MQLKRNETILKYNEQSKIYFITWKRQIRLKTIVFSCSQKMLDYILLVLYVFKIFITHISYYTDFLFNKSVAIKILPRYFPIGK